LWVAAASATKPIEAKKSSTVPKSLRFAVTGTCYPENLRKGLRRLPRLGTDRDPDNGIVGSEVIAQISVRAHPIHECLARLFQRPKVRAAGWAAHRSTH